MFEKSRSASVEKEMSAAEHIQAVNLLKAMNAALDRIDAARLASALTAVRKSV